MSQRFDSIYRRSLEPESFWAEAAEHVHWFKKWDRIQDGSQAPFCRWFPGARVNSCYNALDLQIDRGRGEQAALIYDSPVADAKRSISYRELRHQVSRFAGALRNLGIARGDRVIIYMPMVPEAFVAMLACARLGAIHSVVFGGFASAELASRINDAGPKVIVSASCGIEPTRLVEYQPLLEEAIQISRHKPQHCVLLQREEQTCPLKPGRDLDWDEILAAGQPTDCVEVDATDPLYILYTSGTTGQPKGIVRDNGGHLVALKWSMQNIYNTNPGEVFWAASDVGWVVGHSYIAYGPLFHGCTSIVYEGKPVGTPDAGAYWRVIEEHRVRTLFTAPTAIRSIRREDPEGEQIGKHDLGHFRSLFVAGERCDPDTLLWARERLKVPVIDHWWQTESGWPMAAICLGIEALPVKPGSAGRAVPGYQIQVVDSKGQELPPDRPGSIVVRLPLPPGTLPTLWKADDRFRETYLSQHPGCYATGDAGYMDKEGYLFVMSRTDDIINVAGHRLSTGAMEEVLASQPEIAECAVFGVSDPLKGQLPLGLLVLTSGVQRSPSEIVQDVIHLVRRRIGPVAAFKTAVVVDRLPKTRSGKILRATLRQIADGKDYKIPATIDDPTILEEIQQALRKIGYPR